MPHRLSQVRLQRRHEIYRRRACETTARQFRLAERRRLRSAIGRRNTRDLCAPRCHRSRTLRQPAEESENSLELYGLEVAFQTRARQFRPVRFSRRADALRNHGPTTGSTRTAEKGWHQWLAGQSNASTIRLARLSNARAKRRSIAESCCAIRCTRASSTGR